MDNIIGYLRLDPLDLVGCRLLRLQNIEFNIGCFVPLHYLAQRARVHRIHFRIISLVP